MPPKGGPKLLLRWLSIALMRKMYGSVAWIYSGADHLSMVFYGYNIVNSFLYSNVD